MGMRRTASQFDFDRRRFLGLAAGAAAATGFGVPGSAAAAAGGSAPAAKPLTSASFGPVKQIDAGGSQRTAGGAPSVRSGCHGRRRPVARDDRAVSGLNDVG
jgi:hypothetical protein